MKAPKKTIIAAPVPPEWIDTIDQMAEELRRPHEPANRSAAIRVLLGEGIERRRLRVK